MVVQILMDYSSLFPLLSDGGGINDDDNYAHGDNDVLGGGYDYDIDEYDDMGSDNALLLNGDDDDERGLEGWFR